LGPGPRETSLPFVGNREKSLVLADPVGKIEKASESMDESRIIWHGLAALLESLGENGACRLPQIFESINRINTILWKPEIAIASGALLRYGFSMVSQKSFQKLRCSVVGKTLQVEKASCLKRFHTIWIIHIEQPARLSQMSDGRRFRIDAGLEAMIGLAEIMEERQHCESIQRDILNQGLTSGIGKAGASDRSSHKPPKYTGDIGTMVGKWQLAVTFEFCPGHV
jgi:hypothetical protein